MKEEKKLQIYYTINLSTICNTWHHFCDSMSLAFFTLLFRLVYCYVLLNYYMEYLFRKQAKTLSKRKTCVISRASQMKLPIVHASQSYGTRSFRNTRTSVQKVSTSVLNFALFFSNHSGYFKFCIESFLYRVLLSVDKFVSTTEAQKVSKKSVISIQCQEPITWSVQLLY